MLLNHSIFFVSCVLTFFLVHLSVKTLTFTTVCFSQALRGAVVLLIQALTCPSGFLSQARKVAYLLNVLASGPRTVSIVPERRAEVKTLRIGRWVAVFRHALAVNQAQG